MPQIEIDFEVFKALTARRLTEYETENDVLRALLKLSISPRSKKISTKNELLMGIAERNLPRWNRIHARPQRQGASTARS